MGYLDFTADGVDYRLILVKDIFKKRNEPLEGLDALVLDSNLSFVNDTESILIGNKLLFEYKDNLMELGIPIYTVNPERKQLDGKKENFRDFIEIVHKFAGAGIGAIALTKIGIGIDTIMILGAIGAFNFLKNPMFGDEILDTRFSKIAYTNQASRLAKSYYDLVMQEPRVELINAITALKIKYGVIPNLIEKNPEEYEQRNPRVALIYRGKHRGLKECIQNDGRSIFSINLHRFYGIPMFLDRDKILDIQEYRINEDYSVTRSTFKPPKQEREVKMIESTG